MTSKLALRLYFDIQDTTDLRVDVDGPGTTDNRFYYDGSRGLYYIEINQIPSCRLFGSDNVIKLDFSRNTSPKYMTYNVDHYASKVVNISNSNRFQNVMNRLYYYSTTIGAAFNISAQ